MSLFPALAALALAASPALPAGGPAGLPTAGAPPLSLTAPQMAEVMRTYWDGERLAAVPFVGAGALTLASGGLLLGQGSRLGKAAAWPLLGFGVLEVAAGLAFSLQASSQQAALEKLLAENPQEYARSERQRLQRILTRFQPFLLAFEGVVTLTGGALAGVGLYRGQDTLAGAGLGLALQGLVLFLLDWTVLDRSRGYAVGLELFRP